VSLHGLVRKYLKTARCCRISNALTLIRSLKFEAQRLPDPATVEARLLPDPATGHKSLSFGPKVVNQISS